MKKIEWPGIATAAALICAATIIVAIWQDPDGFKLKDWQPLMAAVLALVGGFFAYQGAMAKVWQERELADRQIRWEKKALVVRLQATLLMLRKTAIDCQAFIEDHPTWKIGGMKLDGLGVPKPAKLDEAWNNLGWFPPHIAFKIATIRDNQYGLLDALTEHKGEILPQSDVEAIRQMFQRTQEHATSILEWTSPELRDVVV